MPYNGKAQKAKSKSEIKKAKQAKANELKQVKTLYENWGLANSSYTEEELEIIAKTGALYEVMLEWGYKSDQVEDYLEEEKDFLDQVLNTARKKNRNKKLTEDELYKIKHQTIRQREKQGQIAREELEDWRNGIIFKL